MQAVILAAGKSQRFYPFTNLVHKSMVDVMGQPLLLHTLHSLKRAEVKDIFIVVGQESTIPQQLEGHIPRELKITYVVQKEKLGMGHALLQAKEYVENSFFLLSGYHCEFDTCKDQLIKGQKDNKTVVLLGKEDTIGERYGVLDVDGEKVQRISEKPSKKNGNVIRVIGMYLLNREFLNTLEATPVEQYHFEKALDAYAKKGQVVWAKASSPTFTLKHAWDLLEVKNYLLSQIKPSISKNAKVSKHATIKGEVVISDNVTIMDGAYIQGPCYLGKNVFVGNNAILRNGVIAEENVVIGATMEAKNSFFMKNVTTHTGFIGDSVIGPYSRLAAGFCTANVRFDRESVWASLHDEKVNTYKTHLGVVMGEHVDTGTNVSTMPGITLGNNVTIGPSTTVMENVQDSMLFYAKFQTIVRKMK